MRLPRIAVAVVAAAVISLTAHPARAQATGTLVPTSEMNAAYPNGQTWQYTTATPPANWANPSFDDSGWQTGQGGFGTINSGGAVSRTAWTATPGDIWLRRHFTITGSVPYTQVRVFHDEDCEIYFNGQLANQESGYITQYQEGGVYDAGQNALQVGDNVLAVHCRQTVGGQYIDVGIDTTTLCAPAPSTLKLPYAGDDDGWMERLEGIPGRVFENPAGIPEDGIKTMSDAGINAVRVTVENQQPFVSSAYNNTNYDNNGLLDALINRENGYGLDYQGIDDQVDIARRSKARGMKVVVTLDMTNTIPNAWDNDTFTQMLTDIDNETNRQLDPFLNAGIQPDVIICSNESNGGTLTFAQIDASGVSHDQRYIGGLNPSGVAYTPQALAFSTIATGNNTIWPKCAAFYKEAIMAAKREITAEGYDATKTRFGLHSNASNEIWFYSRIFDIPSNEPNFETDYYDGNGDDLGNVSAVPSNLQTIKLSSLVDILGYSFYPRTPMGGTQIDFDEELDAVAPDSGGNGSLSADISAFTSWGLAGSVNPATGTYAGGPYAGQDAKKALMLENRESLDLPDSFDATRRADFTTYFLNQLTANPLFDGVLYWEGEYAQFDGELFDPGSFENADGGDLSYDDSPIYQAQPILTTFGAFGEPKAATRFLVANQGGSTVLDVAGQSGIAGATASATSLGTFPTVSQVWTVAGNGDGTYRIANGNSGDVLDDLGGATAGAGIVQNPVGNPIPADQRWTLVQSGTGMVTFVNAATGQALDISSGHVVQNPTGTASSPLWQLQQIPAYSIANETGGVLDVSDQGTTTGSTTTDDAALQGSVSQQWHVIENIDQALSITDANSGLALDDPGASESSGSAITTDTPINPTPAEQKWTLAAPSSASSQIINSASGLALDLTSGMGAQKTKNASAMSQQWEITRYGIPSQLTATATDATITLEWRPAPDAVSYDIERGTESGGPYTTIGSGNTATIYVDTTATAGKAYYYVVSAATPSGTSPDSNQASITAPAPTGVVAWFKADALAGLTSGSTVATWPDASGSGNAATPFNASPSGTVPIPPSYMTNALNGLPVVHFTAAGDSGLGFNRPIQDDFTIFCVFRSTQTSQGGGQAFYNGAGLVNADVPGAVNDFGTSLLATGQVSAGTGNPDTSLQSSGLFNDGKPHVLVFKRTESTGALALFVDDNQVATGTGGTQPLTSPLAIMLGAQQPLGAGGFLDGDIAEVQVDYGALADSQRRATEASLIQKWGIGLNTPAALKATAGNSQISLSWGSVVGAASYSLYRGTTAGGEGATALVTGIKTTNYIDVAVANGVKYYYEVVATDAANSSALSNEASAAPTATVAPAAPANLKAVAGTTAIAVTWSAAPGAASYSLYRGTTAGREGVTPIATGISSATYTDGNVPPSTAYYYKVVAVSTAGSSPFSNEAPATTPAAGLVAWFKADAITGVANGGALPAWPDSSGSGNAATVFHAAPTFVLASLNGLPAARFSSSAQSALAFPRAVQDDFTILCVFRTTQANQGGGQAFYNGAGLVNAEVPGVVDDFGTSLLTTGQVSAGTGNPDTSIQSPASVATNLPQLVTFKRVEATGSLTLYVDGVQAASGTGGAQPLTSPGKIAIGSQQSLVPGGFLNGDIGEIQVYGQALPDAVRQTQEKALIAKWNVGH